MGGVQHRKLLLSKCYYPSPPSLREEILHTEVQVVTTGKSLPRISYKINLWLSPSATTTSSHANHHINVWVMNSFLIAETHMVLMSDEVEKSIT